MVRNSTVERTTGMLMALAGKDFSIGPSGDLKIGGYLSQALQAKGLIQNLGEGKYRLTVAPEPILVRKAHDAANKKRESDGRKRLLKDRATGKRPYTKRSPFWKSKERQQEPPKMTLEQAMNNVVTTKAMYDRAVADFKAML